jgi:hypothetical protein
LTKEQTQKRIRDIPNVIFRWWSGCLSMAKTIAFETRDGPVTPKYRKKAAISIRRKCIRDRVFADGVAAAPAFRRLRRQGYSFEGIDKKVLRDLVLVGDIIEWQANKARKEARRK